MTTFLEINQSQTNKDFQETLRRKMLSKLRNNGSPVVLSLLAIGLAGCGGTDTQTFSSGGTAIKGLLSNATVFIDLDSDGTLDSDELSTTTNADGSFSFLTTDQSKLEGDLIVKTNANTIDSSSGEILSDLTLKAVEGSAVISQLQP